MCISQATKTTSTDSSFNLSASVVPSNATNQGITWSSSNHAIATVSSSGLVCVGSTAGSVTITATSQDGSSGAHPSASCLVTVQAPIIDTDGDGIPDNIDVDPYNAYRTPVILLHGRTDNTFGCYGINNTIRSNPFDTDDNENNHYNSLLMGTSLAGDRYDLQGILGGIFNFMVSGTILVDYVPQVNYTFPGVFNGEFQKGFDGYLTTHSEGGNLGAYLKQYGGYTENLDLFAFNYPNEDAVHYNAHKLYAFIEEIVGKAIDDQNQQLLGKFFKTTTDLANDHYQFDLIGHSMGGLVSRYYIENYEQDEHVRKLITIDTPHWGSGLANTSCITGLNHVLCDHDLSFESAMYGGIFPVETMCNPLNDLGACLFPFDTYTMTDELLYKGKPEGRTISTEYYAIAGIDYNAQELEENNVAFEIPNNLTTYQQVYNAMQNATNDKLYKLVLIGNDWVNQAIDVKGAGDNVVGFLSQMGWTEVLLASEPSKRISFEKIFINIDTDGGNFGFDHYHGKIQHRTIVMQKIKDYLFE